MAQNVAILAGQGQLPQEIARLSRDGLFVTFSDDVSVPDMRHFRAGFEAFGALFAELHAQGITEVIFAGALSRPVPDPAKFDAVTKAMWPRFMRALGQGDDQLLREIIAIFEEQGFRIIAAHEGAPELLATRDMTCGPEVCEQNQADITRGLTILTALSPHDVAQAIVVEGGQVLGLETLQGSDAMLDFVAATPKHLRRGAAGVFIKTAKQGQDLRIDMPVIGPETVDKVQAAGLAGIAITAGRVMVLDQAQVFARLKAAGLFLVVG